MARIRSVHPSLFTNSDWVECSPMARILIIGLWTHADDNGVFAWKPKTIKMEVLPGDNVDIDALMAELVANDLICQFTASGKVYGAVHNFRKWQRPQKPNAIHPLPDDMAAYVGLKSGQSDSDTQPVADEYDTTTGNPIQMEEVGGKREEVGRETIVSLPARESDFSDFVREYPKGKGADKCRKAWELATRTVAPAEIITRLKAAKAEWADRPDQFKPEARNWLRGDGSAIVEVVPASGEVAAVWPGPAEIRKLVVRELSGTAATAYLDRSAWDEETETVIAWSAMAFERLKNVRGLRVAPPKAKDAA